MNANLIGALASAVVTNWVYYRLLAGVTWVAAVVVVLATGPTLQRGPTSQLEAAYVTQTPTSA